jgi:alpha-beta hydrolase superfamily lysophospholipase
VRLRKITGLLRDLIQVLPTRAVPAWSDVDAVPGNTPIVILVSGFGATRRNLSIIRKRLQKDGYHVIVLALDWQALSDSVRGLYRMSEKLSTVVLQLRKGAPARNSRIILVAHSAGGLIARYYIQLLGGSHYCDGLITLATPHRGTWVAAFGLFSHLILKARCLIQMLPIAPFIKRLNAAPFPAHFKMVSIYSKDDLLCPESATRLPVELLQSDNIESHQVSKLSHSDFLLSKKTYRMIVSHLPVPPKRVTVPISLKGSGHPDMS